MEPRFYRQEAGGKEIDNDSSLLTMCGMRRLLLMGVFFAFGGLGFLIAQDEDPESLAKASLISEVNLAKPGTTVWVALRFEAAPHWHLGWAAAGDAGLPTEVKWTSPDGVTVGELHFPVPSRFEYEGFVSYVHEGTFHVLAPVSISVDWDKGKAVLFLLEKMGWGDRLPIHIGDDLTDETVFSALQTRGVGIHVGATTDNDRETQASFGLRDPSEVASLLSRFLERE